MRSAPTEAEHRLWQVVRAHRFNGFKFRRQVPIDHYIVEQFAYFLEKMNSIKEGEKTLLDNSMVVLGKYAVVGNEVDDDIPDEYRAVWDRFAELFPAESHPDLTMFVAIVGRPRTPRAYLVRRTRFHKMSATSPWMSPVRPRLTSSMAR